MQAVETADLGAATARLESQRAQKLLAMHTAEITESDLVRRPIVSPIDGAIEDVTLHPRATQVRERQALHDPRSLARLGRGAVSLKKWHRAAHPRGCASRHRRSRRCRSRVGSYASPIRSIRKRERWPRFSKCRIPDRLLRVGMRLSAQRPVPDAAASTGTQGRVSNAAGHCRRRAQAGAGLTRGGSEGKARAARRGGGAALGPHRLRTAGD